MVIKNLPGVQYSPPKAVLVIRAVGYKYNYPGNFDPAGLGIGLTTERGGALEKI
jgi:hypothetical protein